MSHTWEVDWEDDREGVPRQLILEMVAVLSYIACQGDCAGDDLALGRNSFWHVTERVRTKLPKETRGWFEAILAETERIPTAEFLRNLQRGIEALVARYCDIECAEHFTRVNVDDYQF